MPKEIKEPRGVAAPINRAKELLSLMISNQLLSAETSSLLHALQMTLIPVPEKIEELRRYAHHYRGIAEIQSIMLSDKGIDGEIPVEEVYRNIIHGYVEYGRRTAGFDVARSEVDKHIDNYLKEIFES